MRPGVIFLVCAVASACSAYWAAYWGFRPLRYDFGLSVALAVFFGLAAVALPLLAALDRRGDERRD